MKVALWSIGKQHEKYVEEGIHLFYERLQHYTEFEIKIIPPSKNAGRFSIPEIKKQESALVLEQLDKNDYLIALDEKGKEITTVQLAAFIQQRQNSGTRRLVFLIGGAYGLDESILNIAALRCSLSQLTFPHQLVRLIVSEQLYRAFTILRNEKYHHQ